MSAYFTIEEKSEGVYKEKGSRFLAFAFPVSNEDQIKEILDDLKKKYYDARHHCYAWVLGLSDQTYRSYDDGEPAHSAGDPILGQIRSYELTNVLVVVVRYFGGTKLGKGGLINAYKEAASQALSNADKRTIYEQVDVTMKFSYEMMSTAERLIEDFQIEVTERAFEASCKVSGKLKKEMLPRFQKKISDLYNISFEIDS